ncbi:MAG: hypothetical protein IJT51_05965 [Bacteroidales bacterium]|nr:hypothetical protein [Bacteroidales bacterium]
MARWPRTNAETAIAQAVGLRGKEDVAKKAAMMWRPVLMVDHYYLLRNATVQLNS